MYYLDMFFPTKDDVPDFGSINMTGVGCRIVKDKKKDQFGHDIIMRVRKYILLEKDIEKLNFINNAADGSIAVIADANKVYLLCNGSWYKSVSPSSGGGGGGQDQDAPEEWGDIGGSSSGTGDSGDSTWDGI